MTEDIPTSTGEKVVSRTRDEVIKEAQRIEESALHSSKGHFNEAAIAGWLHVILGLPMVVLAAITGAAAFTKFDQQGILTGVLSIIIVVLSSINTFLNPNKKATDHLNAGNRYEALLNKVRIFRTIECWEQESDQVLSERLKRYSEDKSTLNQNSPQIGWLAYRMAKWGIRNGEANFEVDKPTAA